MNMHILKNKCTFKNNKQDNLKNKVIHFLTKFKPYLINIKPLSITYIINI